jgi:hypothetical protein
MSGIVTLSGFKNLSNTRLNLIGSTSVIFKRKATREPDDDPLPGPTKIPCSLDHLIKSQIIKK